MGFVQLHFLLYWTEQNPWWYQGSLGTEVLVRGLGTEVLCGSWYGVLVQSLGTKSWYGASEGGGEQESYAESYAGLGKVLCGVLCGLMRRQK